MARRGGKKLIVIATPDDEALAQIVEVQRLAAQYFNWASPQRPDTLHMTIFPLGIWMGSRVAGRGEVDLRASAGKAVNDHPRSSFEFRPKATEQALRVGRL